MGIRSGPSLARTTVGLLVASLALAGCAGDAKAGNGIDQAAQNLDIAATSTTGVIRGVVVDEAVRPVADATIELRGGTEGSTTSNEDGAFGFQDLAPGTYFLTVGHKRFNQVQQSAEVVAGVSDPEPVRVLLVALPVLEPFIEALQVSLFISGSGWVAGAGGVTAGGFGVIEGGFGFTEEISANGTVAQTEFVWTKTSDLGTTALVSGGTYDKDDDGVDTDDWSGPSPLVSRVNATEGTDTATQVSYTFWAWPTDPVPAGFHANQVVDVFIHVFHNFRPDDGWTFAGDGAHPLPPP